MDRASYSLKKQMHLVVFLKNIAWMVVLIVICGSVVLMVNRNDVNIDIPKISIYLRNVSLAEINENDKNIVYGDNEVVVEDENGVQKYYGVEMKGRGNYTWTDNKKPYQIKFPNKVNLLDIGEYKKWNLITNNLDDSLMRNDLAQYLAEIVGEEYVVRGKFVRFLVDDENLGLYYLTKKISIGKGLIDLRDRHGVLVELDNNYCQYEDKKIVSIGGDCLVFKDFVNEDSENESIEIFQKKYSDFENAVSSGDYEAMKKVVDVESLAKYYLIGEFSGNPDAYLSSFYYYLDGETDTIHAGPVWDFDGAFGNQNWGNGELEKKAYNPWSDEYGLRRFESIGYGVDVDKKDINEKISAAFIEVVKMPEFLEMVEKIYDERLRVRKSDVMKYLDETTKLIRSDALSDATKWGKNDFDEAAEYLKWWVEQRFALFDMKFGRAIRKLESVEY